MIDTSISHARDRAPTDGAAGLAVITGAGSRLGAAMARELTVRGQAVVGIDSHMDGLAEIHGICRPGLFHPFCADMADPAALRRITATAERDLGPVAILINNAALHQQDDFLAAEAEQVMRQIAVNLGGYVNAAAAVLPFMVERGRGRILNVSSLAGENPVPGSLAHSVSASACRSFNDALAAELAGRLPGVTVTEWIPAVPAAGPDRAEGLSPATAAAWGATLALDMSRDLHGTCFMGDRQILPARSLKRLIKDILLLHPAPRPRILSSGQAAASAPASRVADRKHEGHHGTEADDAAA